jgi:hypothetical protein
VPAAAVIPAPIAYLKVVAVKKLVVGFVVVPTINLGRNVPSLASFRADICFDLHDGGLEKSCLLVV